jgi:hypothetical protein
LPERCLRSCDDDCRAKHEEVVSGEYVRLAVTDDGWRHVADSTRLSPELGLICVREHLQSIWL